MTSLADYIKGMNANKVVLITSLYPPFPEGVQQLWGGIEIDMEDLVRSLRIYEIETTIISFHYIKPVENEDEDGSIKRIGLYYPYLLGKSYKSTASFAYKEFFRPLIFLKLLKLLRKEKPDLVILGKTYQFSLAAYLACMLLRVPYVVRYDWSCPTNPKSELCTFWERFKCYKCVERITGMKISLIAKFTSSLYFPILFSLKSFFWNRSIKVLVVSEFYKRFTESFGVKSDKIEIIPPKSELTFDLKVIDELKRRYKADGEFILLYVGRLEPEKGIEILLGAFEHENLKKEKMKLLIAGMGRLVQLVKDAVKKDKRILYLGLVLHERIGNYFAIADLVVIPSVVPEGYGIVAEEAMSLNKPIIGFKLGALKEILGKYEQGILVEELSVESLAKAIKRYAC